MISVSTAITEPMNATVSPVWACVTSITTAQRKITMLIMKLRLSVIASFGSGMEDMSIWDFPASLRSFLKMSRK